MMLTTSICTMLLGGIMLPTMGSSFGEPVDRSAAVIDVPQSRQSMILPKSPQNPGMSGSHATPMGGYMPPVSMPGTGMPAAGMPQTGMPAAGMPQTRMPAAGMPGIGMPQIAGPNTAGRTPTAGMSPWQSGVASPTNASTGYPPQRSPNPARSGNSISGMAGRGYPGTYHPHLPQEPAGQSSGNPFGSISVPPSTGRIPTTAAMPQAPSIMNEKPFSNYQPKPVFSPYMQLYRTDNDFGTIDNFYSRVLPMQQQNTLNQQLQRNIRSIENTTRIQNNNINQIRQRTNEIQGVPQQGYYMNHLNYFPTYGN